MLRTVFVLTCFAGCLVFCGCSTPPLPPLKGAELKMPFSQFASADTSGGLPMGNEARVDTELTTQGVQYIGFTERVNTQISPAAGADDSLCMKYFECPEGAKPADVARTQPYITAYVAYNKNVLEAVKRRAVRIPDVVYPRNGYTPERTAAVTAEAPTYAGGQIALIKNIFYNGLGDWMLVYYYMDKNGAVASRDKINALRNWQKLPESERQGFLAQVEFSTMIGHGEPHVDGIPEEEIRKAEERMDKFVPLFVAKLGKYLPNPVK